MDLRKMIRESLENHELIQNKYGDMVPRTKSFFGNFDMPKSTFKSDVKDKLINILMSERKISEKSFTYIDELYEEFKNFFASNPEADLLIEKFESKKVRPEFVAELIYAKFKALQKDEQHPNIDA